MLYIIGLGLGDHRDITIRGLEAVKSCDKVYLEGYTSLLQCTVEEMSSYYGKEIIVADRSGIEKGGDDIVDSAKDQNVAVLVIGDVFGATTHWDLFTRAKEVGVEVELIHNTSILLAVGDTGLQLYKFGRVASIPFPQENWVVDTPYTILRDNKSIGLHSLFLLDLDPPQDKYMTVNEAIKNLLSLEEKQAEGLITENTIFVGCARLGTDNAMIKVGTAKELLEVDFGGAPHCLIIPGKMHFMEEEGLELFTNNA